MDCVADIDALSSHAGFKDCVLILSAKRTSKSYLMLCVSQSVHSNVVTKIRMTRMTEKQDDNMTG